MNEASLPAVSIRSLILLTTFLLGINLLGCDTTATEPSTEIVVEAYLQAGATLPPVRLSRTVSVNEPYDPTANAVRDAEVRVQQLTSDSTVAATISYSERDSVPGLYTPDVASLVQPQTTYRLQVQTNDEASLTSTTTVPGPIEVVETRNDTAAYQGPNQPAFTVDLPRRGGNSQNVFTFTTVSLLDFQNTPDSTLRQALTPFYADGFDPEEDSLASLRTTSSGLLNEGNFERNADDTITIDLPWLAVAFFGPNEIGVNVVDDNYYDFLRSQQVQQGGFAPGEIPNVIEHVDGGTGIFGSYAQAVRPVLIQSPNRTGNGATEASSSRTPPHGSP